MSERETPETDELWSRDRGSESLLAHARKLERERDEAREALGQLATAITHHLNPMVDRDLSHELLLAAMRIYKQQPPTGGPER